jgi:hypothetical protein
MRTAYKLIGKDENGNETLVSNNTGIVSEKNAAFNNLKEAFEAFNNLDSSVLEKDCFFELVKLNEDKEIEDWTNEELDSIGWKINTWVTKSN